MPNRRDALKWLFLRRFLCFKPSFQTEFEKIACFLQVADSGAESIALVGLDRAVLELFQGLELGGSGGGFEGLDGIAEALGLLEHEVLGEVFFIVLEVMGDFGEFGDQGFGVVAVLEQDLHQLGCAIFAGPGVLLAGVSDTGAHAFLDVVLGHEA